MSEAVSAAEQARWVELYATLETPLYNVVYRVIWDSAESQDVVQEAFLRCWRRRDRLRAETVKALLFRTALNIAINRRRRKRLWRFVGLESAEPDELQTEGGDGVVSRHLRQAIEALPEPFRQVVLLTELAGMTYAEVAQTLGIREGTVGSRRARALALLRQALQPESSSPDLKLSDTLL